MKHPKFSLSMMKKGLLALKRENTMPTLSYLKYLEVVSLSAESAKTFIGRTDEPVDLGPADPKRYREGSRVWGFPFPKKTYIETH